MAAMLFLGILLCLTAAIYGSEPSLVTLLCLTAAIYGSQPSLVTLLWLIADIYGSQPSLVTLLWLIADTVSSSVPTGMTHPTGHGVGQLSPPALIVTRPKQLDLTQNFSR